MTQDEPYKVVDLFSGAGGLSIGFDAPEWMEGLGDLGYEDLSYDGPGFETILAVEFDEAAANTFQHNFPDAEVKNTDINEIEDFSQWDDADIVIGGPPCKGFTTLTQQKTEELDDERNRLWEEYMRAVEQIDPDVFLIENVPRFLKAYEGKDAYEMAEDMGYTVVADTMYANEFGAPQKRRRGFIIASKKGTPFFPEPNEDEDERTVRDAIGDLPEDPGDSDDSWHRGRNVQKVTKKRMKKISIPGGDRRDLRDHPELLPDCWKDDEGMGFTDTYGRLWWDRPSVTIRTGFYQPMKGRHLHPVANRTITPREGARLQTFPDNFEFPTRAKTKMASQVGNAVPPKLAYELATAIHAHLHEGVTGELESGDEESPYETAHLDLSEQ